MMAIDLEGVAGVVGMPGLGLTREACPEEYDLARREAIRAVNAAARALFDSGATRVVAWDNHGSGVNLDPGAIDNRCEILRGALADRFAGAEDFDGVLLIGYHAMAGTIDGALNHTFSSKDIQYIRVNGVDVGEIAVDAHFAGLKGVPVIFVLSDRAGVREAARFLPWARSVASKEGLGRNCALAYHPERVEEETYEQVRGAVENLSDMGLFWFESPLTLEIRYMRMEEARARLSPEAELVDAYTTRQTMDALEL